MSAPPATPDPRRLKLLSSHEVPGTLFASAIWGDSLLVGDSEGRLHSLDLHTLKVTERGSLHDNAIASLHVCGDVLISGGWDRRIVWTDLKTMKPLRRIDAHAGWVRKVALSSDGSRLVSVGDDMRVKIFANETGRELGLLGSHDARTPEGFLSALYTVALSPDGRNAASADRAGFVKVWDVEKRHLVTTFRAEAFYTFDAAKRARAIGGIRGLAFSPDGARLALSGIGPVTNVDGFVGPLRLELWDWKSKTRLSIGEAKHQAILNAVTYGPGRWLTAVGGGDGGGAAVFWDGTEAPILLKPKGHLHSHQWVRDRLCLVGHGGVQLWG